MQIEEFKLYEVPDFPIVRIREACFPLCGARVVEMNALLAQAKPFVFIFLDSAESPANADQKAQAKWLKTNKKQLRRVCRGFVSIEPDPAKRLLKRAR
jgi:hypothetical protein